MIMAITAKRGGQFGAVAPSSMLLHALETAQDPRAATLPS